MSKLTEADKIVFKGKEISELYIGTVFLWKEKEYGDKQNYSTDKIGSNVQLGKAPVDSLLGNGGFKSASLKTLFQFDYISGDALMAGGGLTGASTKKLFDFYYHTDALSAEGGFVSVSLKTLDL